LKKKFADFQATASAKIEEHDSTIPSVLCKQQGDSALTLNDQKSKINNVSAIATLGSVMRFGRYDWRVLDVQGNRALLLSDRIVDTRTYTEKEVNSTWATCSLRKYLNGDFHNDSFSAEEKTRILESTLLNLNNPEYGTPGGMKTLDKVFLLSIEEFGQYLMTGNKGRSINLLGIFDWRSKSKKAIDAIGNASKWWLRSPGQHSYQSSYVCSNGKVDVSGSSICVLNYGVRPALWLKL